MIPADVQLTSLAGNVASGVGTAGGAGVGLRSGIAGPALEMVGCTSSQAAVANFIEALKDIDGVTRVGLQGSSMGGGGNATTAGSCESRRRPSSSWSPGSTRRRWRASKPAAKRAPEVAAPEASAESSTETTSSESSESSSSESSSSSSSEEVEAE